MASNINTEKIILGIDPGTMVMGYGIIREQGLATLTAAAVSVNAQTALIIHD